MKRTLLAVLAALLLLATGVAPASADRLRLHDAVGDAAGDEDSDVLDIRRVTLDNRARVLVARVRFDALVAGDVVVSIDRRGGKGLRMVARRTADGRTPHHLFTGAFTDRDEGGRRVRCRAYSASWNARQETVTFRLPSRCWNRGRYGAVRLTVLSEDRGGDADLAPDNRHEVSRWVPRG